MSATVISGVIHNVTSGQIDIDDTVDSGGVLNVLSDGKVSNTQDNGAVYVSLGGSANGTVVNSGGTLTVLSGGLADPTTIYSGGLEIVSTGGTDDGAEISGGEQDVNGYASGATVFTGSQVVEAGGTTSSTVISGGLEVVSAGGTDDGAQIAGGEQDVYGYASGATVFTGSQVVEAGGTVSSTVISGGLEVVSGTDFGAQISGGEQDVYGYASGTTVFTGSQVIEAGGTASSTIISGGLEIVSAGGTDDGAQISGGEEDVFGYASSATVFTGSQVVESGGTASSTIISGGLEIVSAGGTDDGPQIAGGEQEVYGYANSATVFTGSQVVEAGGIASGTIVISGLEIVSSGGTDVGAQIAGGEQDVYGYASGAAVFAGSQVVEAGGTASGTIVSSGTLELLGNASAGGFTVSSSGILEIASGYVLSGYEVANGVTVEVANGGTVSGTTISDSGTLELLDEGIQSGAVFQAGGIYEIGSGAALSDYAVSSGWILEVAFSGSVSDTVVSGNGELVVLSGGLADPTTIYTGGSETVSAGGTDDGAQILGTQSDNGYASGAMIASGGVQYVAYGGTGTTTGTTISNGGAQVVGAQGSGTATSTTVLIGGVQYVGYAGWGPYDDYYFQPGGNGTTDDTTILNGGQQYVGYGANGTADDTTILNGGVQYVGYLYYYTGIGTATNTTISSGGTQIVGAGGLGTATITTIDSGGSEIVNAGGTDDGAQISGGEQDVHGYASGAMVFTGSQVVEGGGTASNTTIDSGGLEIVNGGGTDDGVQISGGEQDVNGYASGATVFTGSQVVEAGGTASNTTVDSGGDLYVLSAGTASGTIVSSGGTLDVLSGGTAIAPDLLAGGTFIIGGTLSGFTVSNGVTLDVSAGTAINTYVLGGGTEIVSSGGIADGITISGAGTAELLSGAIVSGRRTFVNDGGTLEIGDTASAFLAGLAISGLGGGDTIDLTDVSFVSGATASVSGGFLDVTVGGTTYALGLGTPNTFPAVQRFVVSGDGMSGTDVTFNAALFVSGSSQTPAPRADLNAGKTVSITLDMNEHDLKVSGTPGLTLNDGGSATYVSSASNLAGGVLVFNYTVSSGQNTTDLEVTGVTSGGWSVTDTDGHQADFSGAQLNLGIAVDTNTPAVVSVASLPTSGGIVGSGHTVSIDLDLNDLSDGPLVVSGTPTLKLNDGGTATYNSAESNLTSGILEFDYTVLSGQSTSDLMITSASQPSGASIKDLAGNAANLTLTAAEKNLLLTIDGTPPTVTSVTHSPASGPVVSGDVITITLTTSEPVTVSGTPELTLNDGQAAGYIGGSGTTTLTFEYDVGSESTTDLQVIGIDQAGGNTIVDHAGNQLSSTLSANLELGVNVYTFTHTTGGGGSWNSAANWSPAVVPGPGNTALLTNAGTYTVNSTQDNQVDVVKTAPGATLAVGFDTSFEATDGTGTGANAGTITLADATRLLLGGTFDNSGSIALNATLNYSQLVVDSALTLSGGGKLTLSNNSNNAITGYATLTNVNNTIAGAGTIGDLFGYGYYYLSIVNQAKGVIDATGTVTNPLTLYTPGNVLENAGTLEATDPGGLVISNTIVGNAPTGVIAALGSGANVNLDNATISGGIFKTSGTNAVIDTTGPDTISGGTLALGSLVKVNDGTTLTLAGIIANSGTISVSADNDPTSLAISGAVVLTGSGKVTLSNNENNSISASSSGATLTNVNNTIAGAGTIGVGDENLTLLNSGTINADTAFTLTIATGSNTVSNSGTLEATASGGLMIESDIANARTIEAIGADATALISGATISNATSGLILASGSGANVDLQNAVILSGKLQTIGTSALIETVSATNNEISGGTIFAGSLVKVNDGTTLTLAGVIANSGTISVSADNSQTSLKISGAVTLSGGGKVTLSDNSNNAIVANGSPATLTNVNNTIAGAGTIGDANLTLVNRGVIDGDASDNRLSLNTGANAIVNSGTLEATGGGSGGLVISGTTIDNAPTGAILASSGGFVDLASVTIFGGTLQSVSSGDIDLDGADNVLSGVTNQAALSVDTTTELQGSVFNNSGELDIDGTLRVDNSMMLSGGGTIDLNDFISGVGIVQTHLIRYGGGLTLTNVNNKISGGGTVGNSDFTLINQSGGTINANGKYQPLTLSGAIVNAGVLEATSFSQDLIIAGAVSNSKTIEALGTSATVLISGAAVNNAASGAILASSSGAQVELDGAVISGGKLQTIGANAVIETVNGSTNAIRGVAIASGSLVEVNDGTTLTLAGTIINSGDLNIDGSLQVDAGLILSGGGTINLNDFISGIGIVQTQIIPNGGGLTLTNVNDKITGGGTVGNSDFTLINQSGGTINANGKYQSLTLSGAIVNAGVLEATSFSQDLVIAGAVANSKTIEALGTSATVLISGAAISNTASGIILASGSGAQVDLDGAVISGGKLQTIGTNAVIETVNGSTNAISGVAIASGSLLNVNEGTTLTLAGTVNNSGEINIDGGLQVDAGVILSGGGTVDLNDFISGVGIVQTQLLPNGSVTLTNANNKIAGGGTVGNGNFTLINQSGGIVNANGEYQYLTLSGAIVNAGVLEATSFSQDLVIAASVSNTKTIEAIATSATVLISGTTISNAVSGTILASGSGAQVELDGAVVSGGKLQTIGTNAVIESVNDSTNAISGGTLMSSSTIEVTSGSLLTLSGGTIAARATIETLSSGSAIVSGTVINSGTLFASGSGSLLQIASGGVVSAGAVEVGNGVVEVQSGGTANVTFSAGSSGGLELDGTGAIAVRISGFGVSGGVSHSDHHEYIDFTAIGAGATFTYTSGAGNTSGTLTVSSGGVSASVELIGSYTSGNFSSGTLNGSIEITDPAVYHDHLGHGANIALLGGYIASFAAEGHGGSVITDALQADLQPPLLAHPQA
jgi:autotransporter passenger strand-loop-strand repeat protein